MYGFNNSPTASWLKEVIHYCPESGIFKWIKNPSKCHKIAGNIAGNINSIGYVVFSVNNWPQLAHRMAFIYMIGKVPECVDHINRIRHDNRWCNLRPYSHIMNCNNGVSNKLITYNGSTRTQAQWSRILDGNNHLVSSRISCGWTPIEAVSTPVGGKRHA